MRCAKMVDSATSCLTKNILIIAVFIFAIPVMAGLVRGLGCRLQNGVVKEEEAKKEGGWLAGLLDTILGNLQLHVGSLHVRFEAEFGAAGARNNLLALGVTLDKCAPGGSDGD